MEPTFSCLYWTASAPLNYLLEQCSSSFRNSVFSIQDGGQYFKISIAFSRIWFWDKHKWSVSMRVTDLHSLLPVVGMQFSKDFSFCFAKHPIPFFYILTFLVCFLLENNRYCSIHICFVFVLLLPIAKMNAIKFLM